eukprot:TRINITY_DN10125_c0_g1_i4.p1 TRINITY_DN10125_c0_g1~~TRINITY_DN10125_c0_g1_i4.p1  ORF type:complete len:563 (+),score=105.80 TRINITY_DN10125_c0_g1_i4:31-1719(+)
MGTSSRQGTILPASHSYSTTKPNTSTTNIHLTYLKDYILTNSKSEDASGVELIFGGCERVCVSGLVAYLVFPFLAEQLNSFDSLHTILLPSYTWSQFSEMLTRCFDCEPWNLDLDENIDIQFTENSCENESAKSDEDREKETTNEEMVEVDDTSCHTFSQITCESDENCQDITVENRTDDKSDDCDNLETVNHVIVVEEDIFLECKDTSCNKVKTKSETNNDLLIKSDDTIILDENTEDIDESNLDSELSNNIISRKAKSPTTHNYTENNNSPVSKYVCNACQESFESRSLCMLHVSGGECGAKLKHAFKAMQRSLELQRRRYRELHDDIISNGEEEAQADRDRDILLACSHCHKSFKHRAHLVQHLRSHTKEKPFKCEECARAFSTKGNLKIHMERHKDPSHRKFKCSECDFTATSSVLLKYHMNAHSGVKMFECQDCGVSYMRPHSLRKHRRQGCNTDKLANIPRQPQLKKRLLDEGYSNLPNLLVQTRIKISQKDSSSILQDEEGEVIEESCVVITDAGDELPHYGVDDMNLLVVPLVQQSHSQQHLEEVVACNMQLYS